MFKRSWFSCNNVALSDSFYPDIFWRRSWSNSLCTCISLRKEIVHVFSLVPNRAKHSYFIYSNQLLMWNELFRFMETVWMNKFCATVIIINLHFSSLIQAMTVYKNLSNLDHMKSEAAKSTKEHTQKITFDPESWYNLWCAMIVVQEEKKLSFVLYLIMLYQCRNKFYSKKNSVFFNFSDSYVLYLQHPLGNAGEEAKVTHFH